MMRAATAMIAALAALQAAPHAHAQVVLGRLFSSPEERAQMEAARGGKAALLPNSQGMAPAPGMPGGPPAAPAMGVPGPAGGVEAASPPASALTMTGVLRSSDNRTVVWLNGVPQPGLQNKLSQGGQRSPDVTVTLPSGRKITLKAGQRYDLNESRIKDVNEP